MKKKIQKQLGQYKLRITEIDGKTETIQGSAIDLTYVDDGKIDELLSSQDRWKWITAFSAKKTYELAVTTTYDEKKLTGVLDDMSCFQQENIVAPEDAYLEEQDGEYVIRSGGGRKYTGSHQIGECSQRCDRKRKDRNQSGRAGML